MKRSEINAIVRDAEAFMGRLGAHLPPFARWTPQVWATKGEEVREIVANQLGWDITDFGSGAYARRGLLMFTIRNGHPDNLRAGRGKLYAEKALLVDVGQVTPFHFHWHKTEDIINRGGGALVLELYNSSDDGGLLDTDVTVHTDGVRQVLPAGGRLTLEVGESVTLPTGLYHQFWAERARVLLGEVSNVNDDTADNRFLEPVGRFATIEEDEAMLYPLYTDYPKVYRP